MAIGPTRAPPTLCAQFHTLIHVPLSLMENQWVITLPQGGQPIPLNQPTRKFRAAITATAAFSCAMPIHWTGTIMNAIEIEAMTSPRGRNLRASLLSEMLAMRNFENP